MAHRTRSEVLIHEIEVKNNGNLPVTVLLEMHIDSKKVTSTTQSVKGNLGLSNYKILSGKGLSSTGNEYVHVAVAFPEYQSTMHVPQKSRNRISLASIISYHIEKLEKKFHSERTKKSVEIEDQKIEGELSTSIGLLLLELVRSKNEFLLKEHVSAWNEIWKVCISYDLIFLWLLLIVPRGIVTFMITGC